MLLARRLMRVALLLWLPLATAAPDAQWQSLDDIRKAVEAFVRGREAGPGTVTSVSVDRLDPRLRLRACSAPLAVSRASGYSSAGRLTATVACASPKPWKVYVPVKLVRRIGVVVGVRPLPRGHTITRDDVTLQETDIGRIRGRYYTDSSDIIGQEMRRAAARGEVIEPGDVNAPRLVRRGQGLLIEANADTITVRMRGEALEDGREGDLIRVRNHSSDRIVEARVVGRDRVRVIF